MRISLRAAFGVTFVLVLFMLCAYQAHDLHEEYKIRMQKGLRIKAQNEQKTNSRSKTKNHFFQPADEVEFPTKEGPPRIPHIIHQVLNNEYVIANYSKYIKSFTKHNPKWEYRFWTHASGRRLIQEKHPYLLKTFDSFSENDVKKTDFVKFAAMYEYGGIYSDIDVMNLRPLDIATTKYACIIPTEPFEHSSFIYQLPVVINTAILLCRPNHPFFKFILESIKATNPAAHPLKVTGALKVTTLYTEYNNITFKDIAKSVTSSSTNTPYFYKGTRQDEDDDSIYIPNSQYFMDTIDPIFLIVHKNETTPLYCKHLRPINEHDNIIMSPNFMMRGCFEYFRRKQIRKNKKFTFTQHYWNHIWSMNSKWLKSLKKLHIKEIVPNYKSY